MGKFSQYDRKVQEQESPWKIHPIWRGIGCLMMVIIPAIAYAGAVLLIDANFEYNWIPFPREFIGPQRYPLLYAQIGVTIILSVLGYLLFVLFYSMMYRFVGPPAYGPTDSPPERSRRNRRSRSR